MLQMHRQDEQPRYLRLLQWQEMKHRQILAETSAKAKFLSVEIALGVHHAFSKKKNMFLMTVSFALSMILFLSFSVMISWIGHALTSMDPHSPDLEVYHQGYHNELSKELCQEIRGIDGVKYVTGRMHIEAEVNCNKNVTTVDLISYDELQFERTRSDGG